VGNPVTEKVCNRCRAARPASEFCIRRRSRDGLAYTCKPCSRQYINAKFQAMKPAVRRATWRSGNGAFRARRLGSQVGHPVDLLGIFSRDGGLCYLCGLIVPEDDVEYDHKQPLSRGGQHTAENIGVTHKACNRRKGAQTVGEYLAARPAPPPQQMSTKGRES
jgi:5-methylcytosine-specific restriction endonuclease McrA